MSSISKEQAPRITSEQVEHIAKLARIELTDQEKEKFTSELSSILDYFGKLNQIDTSKVEPINQITGLKNVVRKDESKDNILDARDKILDEVPSKKGDYYKVPKILE